MKPCPHLIVQVEEENALGMTVSCVSCKATFDMSDAVCNYGFLPFVYTRPGPPEGDITVLMHESLIDLER